MSKTPNSKAGIRKFRNIRVGVLMGGMSTERDISLKSGNAVCNALIEKGYRVVAVDVHRDVCNKLRNENVDVAFIALHGRYGEDGTIQGLLELAGIPYTGSGVLASALSINKAVAKSLFVANKISTPSFRVIKKGDSLRSSMFNAITPPIIVKPNSQGSTIGVSVVHKRGEIADAIKNAMKYDDTVIVERFIRGREVTVGILKNRALPIVEVKPPNGIYDYRAKYTKGMTEYIVPARLLGALKKKVTDLAMKAFTVLGCSGVARVDIMLDIKERPYVLEVNTVPGMTEMSLLPKAAACAGMGFSDLVEEILLGALHKMPFRRGY